MQGVTQYTPAHVGIFLRKGFLINFANYPHRRNSDSAFPSVAMTWWTAAVPAASAGITYTCPMHPQIRQAGPGNCPICGMTLVPVSQTTLKKLQPGGKLLYYTCPMPEHSDIHADKPGNCPKCSMTLIPVMEAPPIPQPSATSAAIPSTLYTCPMAVHADVVSDKPGKCPKCEMELVSTSTVAHGKIAEENWRKQHPPMEDSASGHQH